MFEWFRKLWTDKRGNAIIIATAFLPVLVGSAGLATDTIQWALWKRQLQRSADSAAIAGVYDRVQNAGSTGLTATAVAKDLTFNQNTGHALVAGYPLVTFPADSGTLVRQVKVELAVKKRLAFSGLFMEAAPEIKAAATAASVPGTDEYCVISLQNNSKTGILGSGSSTITSDCGMITNSISNNAAVAQGSSMITATVIAAAGGIQQSSNWNVGKYDPYVPAQADPYANLTPEPSDFSSCAASPPALSIGSQNSGQTITGNTCYSSLSVGSNRTLTLQNGTFIINGGSLNVQGTLNVVNATIILSNKNTSATAPIGSFDMNAQAQLNITPPTSGKWKGMAIYQDRRAVDSSPTGSISSSSPNKINGGSGAAIQGVVYFPSQQITYNGNNGGVYRCTQIVVKRVVFTGNNAANITKNCNGVGVDPINGGRRVRLVA